MLNQHEKKDIIEVSDSLLTFNDVYNKPYIPKEHEQSIKDASVLFLPSENHRNLGLNLFPENTRDLYSYFIREAEREGIKVEICASDDDFKTLELHSELIYIAKMICTYVVLPIVCSLISAYLYDKIKKTNRTDLDATIELLVEKDEKTKRIYYNGNAAGFKEAIECIKDTLFADDE